MTATAALRAGRRAIEALMVDTVLITRITGMALNESTLAEEPTTTTVYAGKGRFNPFDPYEQTPNVPGGTATVQRDRLSIPMGEGPVVKGDLVTITASALDANSVGRTYRVASVTAGTHATAQRVALEDVS